MQLADHDAILQKEKKKKKVAQMINDRAVRKIKLIHLKTRKGICSFAIIW